MSTLLKILYIYGKIIIVYYYILLTWQWVVVFRQPRKAELSLDIIKTTENWHKHQKHQLTTVTCLKAGDRGK